MQQPLSDDVSSDSQLAIDSGVLSPSHANPLMPGDDIHPGAVSLGNTFQGLRLRQSHTTVFWISTRKEASETCVLMRNYPFGALSILPYQCGDR